MLESTLALPVTRTECAMSCPSMIYNASHMQQYNYWLMYSDATHLVLITLHPHRILLLGLALEVLQE